MGQRKAYPTIDLDYVFSGFQWISVEFAPMCKGSEEATAAEQAVRDVFYVDTPEWQAGD